MRRWKLLCKENVSMTIKQITDRWFVLKTEGLVFFGYSRGHVLHKYHAWVREYDLKQIRNT